MSKENKTAVAYLRTSSRTNVGVDKDSDKRSSISANPERSLTGTAPLTAAS